MATQPPKILIVGVGNSGTKLLGTLVNELLKKEGYTLYYYEPLYWSGIQGEEEIVINHKAIREHQTFPLLPNDSLTTWPWMNNFIDNLVGLAKFIKAGSRIRLFIEQPVKILWITRELYSYLASMQKNFPRCLPDRGWHHRPGEYDDFNRLKAIYSDFDLRAKEEYRIEVEAAWWHLHNSEVMKYQEKENVYHIHYESLCERPIDYMKRVADFINIPFVKTKMIKNVHPVPDRKLLLSPRSIWIIDAMAGSLNKMLYAKSQVYRQYIQADWSVEIEKGPKGFQETCPKTV